MKQHKKSIWQEAAEQWWDDQESQLDALSDLNFNEIDLEDIGNDEDESDTHEPV